MINSILMLVETELVKYSRSKTCNERANAFLHPVATSSGSKQKLNRQSAAQSEPRLCKGLSMLSSFRQICICMLAEFGAESDI